MHLFIDVFIYEFLHYFNVLIYAFVYLSNRMEQLYIY